MDDDAGARGASGVQEARGVERRPGEVRLRNQHSLKQLWIYFWFFLRRNWLEMLRKFIFESVILPCVCRWLNSILAIVLVASDGRLVFTGIDWCGKRWRGSRTTLLILYRTALSFFARVSHLGLSICDYGSWVIAHCWAPVHCLISQASAIVTAGTM